MQTPHIIRGQGIPRRRPPRLEAKALGIGMEGGRWYQGWFDPPKMRLALARGRLDDLGIVRDDPGLIRQALDRFEALGLSWHAGQTGCPHSGG